MTTNSCEKLAALMSFDAAEKNASILNYNLPASTTYTVQLYIPVEVPDEYWTKEAKTLPADNPYAFIPNVEESSESGRQLRLEIETTRSKITDSLGKYMAVGGYNPGQPDDPIIYQKALEIENEIKKMAASHPALSMLSKLQIADSFSVSTMSDQTLVNQQMKPMGRKVSNIESQLELRPPIFDSMVLAAGISDGKFPKWHKTFFGRTILKQMVPPVKEADPRLYVIEEIEIASYLGNYGAGKTVKTFSLLPGEKTTISIKTWKTEKTDQDIKQNILDSYSEESASSFEKQVEEEFSNSMQTQSDASDSFSTSYSESETKTKSGNVGGSLKINIGIASLGGGGGYSTTNTTSQSLENSTQSTASVSRSNAANSLQNALDKHAGQSAASRKHDINIETNESKSTEQGQEEAIIRELQNINYSRVLNFVFRALNQEYLTIIYLKDISFGFTRGVPGDGISTKLENLDNFLSRYIKTDQDPKKSPLVAIRNKILENLLAVYDFNGNRQEFIEKRIEWMPNLDPNLSAETKSYQFWRKMPVYSGSPSALNSAEAEANPDKYGNHWEGKRVNGIILSVAKRILPTDALIVDALLGQGEALDCYNMRLQKAAADQADLENDRSNMALNILKGDMKSLEIKAKSYSEMLNPRREHGHE